jgi:hypothetical protein
MNKVRLFCGLALVLMLGCKHGHSLVGTWTGSNEQGQESVTFGDDNKLKSKLSVSGVNIDINGTYTLKDSQLERTVVSLDLHATDPTKEANLERNKSALVPRLLTRLNADKMSKIEWKSDDEFVESDKTGKPMTFTRSK